MYAVIEQNGKFSGVVYDELTDNIIKYHEQYNQTFLEVDERPVDIVPPSPNPDDFQIPDYGEPTRAQLRVGMNWKHETYLASTDWYVLRKVETGAAIPAEISTKRTKAREALDR